MQLSARVIALTKPLSETNLEDTEQLMAFCARVSNPSNQDNYETAEKLLRYCMKHKHWSVFEMANAVVAIEAPRDITRQLLRHRSFSFQEFSQRYSSEVGMTERSFRKQDKTNRQNSTQDLPPEAMKRALDYSWKIAETTRSAYRTMIKDGVAKECARVVLPEGLTMSSLYVNGTLRSWLHYLDVRDCENVTQWEHVILAREIKKVLTPHFPMLFRPTKSTDTIGPI